MFDHRCFSSLTITFTLLLLLIGISLHAAQNEIPEFSLRDVIKIGLKHSPRIKKSAAEFSSAQAQTREALGALLPQINLKSTATQNDDEFYRAYIDATQPLYVGGALTGALSFHKHEEAIAQLKLANETQNVIHDVVATYYNMAQQTQLVDAAV